MSALRVNSGTALAAPDARRSQFPSVVRHARPGPSAGAPPRRVPFAAVEREAGDGQHFAGRRSSWPNRWCGICGGHYNLAIDDRRPCIDVPSVGRDLPKPISPIIAATGKDFYRCISEVDLYAVAVELDLLHPVFA